MADDVSLMTWIRADVDVLAWLLPLEVRFLGFGRDMPWSTYVLLVSSGEGLMCTDLIS